MNDFTLLECQADVANECLPLLEKFLKHYGVPVLKVENADIAENARIIIHEKGDDMLFLDISPDEIHLMLWREEKETGVSLCSWYNHFYEDGDLSRLKSIVPSIYRSIKIV